MRRKLMEAWNGFATWIAVPLAYWDESYPLLRRSERQAAAKPAEFGRKWPETVLCSSKLMQRKLIIAWHFTGRKFLL